MRTRTRSILVAGCVLGTVACAQTTPTSPGVTGPTPSGVTDPTGGTAARTRAGRAGMITKPLNGRFDSTESPPVADPPDGCVVLIETTHAGNATQLGSFHGTGTTCAVPASAPVEVPPFWEREPAPPYFVADFTTDNVWTAADGSELWLQTVDGVFVQSLSNGAASVKGTIEIRGGTGRFEGASGSVAAAGGRAPGEAGDHVEFEGQITLCRPGEC